MKKIKLSKKKHNDGEAFVWITLSDLLTTLFMVFMVIGLWAISKKDELSKAAEEAKEAGKKCLIDTANENKVAKEKAAAAMDVGKLVVMQFSLLQKNNICPDVNVEINNSKDGFNLYQTSSQELRSSWFEDG